MTAEDTVNLIGAQHIDWDGSSGTIPRSRFIKEVSNLRARGSSKMPEFIRVLSPETSVIVKFEYRSLDAADAGWTAVYHSENKRYEIHVTGLGV